MPTYQYACTACGHQHEAVQTFTDPSLTECPQCQGPLRKLFSGVGIVFKGSGFYRTDSRNGTSAKTSESGDTSPSGTDSKPASASTEKSSASTGKTGSKPAAAAAPAAS